MNAFLTSIGYPHWVLPALLAIPLVGAALIWAVSPHTVPGEDEVASGTVRTPRAVALLFFAIEFIVSLGLWWSFAPGVDGWQSVVDFPWIPSWGVRFTIGIDGIAVMMILLTTFIMLLAIGGSWTSIRARTRAYYSMLLVL